jgi:hypothetical protein
MRLAMFAALAMLGLGSLPVWGEPLLPQEAKPYGADLLARVRVAATVIPGALPSRINYIKLAESHRPRPTSSMAVRRMITFPRARLSRCSTRPGP